MYIYNIVDIYLQLLFWNLILLFVIRNIFVVIKYFCAYKIYNMYIYLGILYKQHLKLKLVRTMQIHRM